MRKFHVTSHARALLLTTPLLYCEESKDRHPWWFPEQNHHAPLTATWKSVGPSYSQSASYKPGFFRFETLPAADLHRLVSIACATAAMQSGTCQAGGGCVCGVEKCPACASFIHETVRQIEGEGKSASLKFPCFEVEISRNPRNGQLVFEASGDKGSEIFGRAVKELARAVMEADGSNKSQRGINGFRNQNHLEHSLMDQVFFQVLADPFRGFFDLGRNELDYQQPESEAMLRPSQGETHRGSARNETGNRLVKAKEALESLGAIVVLPGNSSAPKKDHTALWADLAGYEQVKRRIEDTIIVGLKFPGLFEKVAGQTRGGGSSRPRVVLFEGPPGCGKTSTAKIISSACGLPFVYIPLEAVVSKWYGESEKTIGKIFELSKQLAAAHAEESGAKDESGCLLFIDEVDSIAASRDETHEVSKKVLSVMLRQLDGFSTESGHSVLICATNRKAALDPAFLSRVDTSVLFGLPDEKNRVEIFTKYARHLSSDELQRLGRESDGLSGRNIKDVATDAERTFVADQIRKGVREDEIGLPRFELYQAAVKEKRQLELSGKRKKTLSLGGLVL